MNVTTDTKVRFSIFWLSQL